MAKVSGAPNVFQPFPSRQLLSQRDLIYNFIALVEGKAGFISPFGPLQIEIFFLEEGGDFMNRLAINEKDLYLFDKKSTNLVMRFGR